MTRPAAVAIMSCRAGTDFNPGHARGERIMSQSFERKADEPPSEKLDRSGGVICPPVGVDPGIASPPPDGGKMPVIPPPGSPGGDPTVRPKM